MAQNKLLINGTLYYYDIDFVREGLVSVWLYEIINKIEKYKTNIIISKTKITENQIHAIINKRDIKELIEEGESLIRVGENA